VQSAAMCIQYYRTYTCGCKRNEEFVQCDERLGTNVRCDEVHLKPLLAALHMCFSHMVEEGNDEMHS